MSLIRSFVQLNIGDAIAAPSTTASANGLLAALMPLASGSAKVGTTYPALSSGINVTTPDSLFGTSGWTTLLSSGTLTGHFLAVIGGEPSGGQSECQIATGAAGSEVLVASMHLSAAQTAPVLPPVQWPTNERVSARAGGSSSGITVCVTVGFRPRPI